MSDNICGCLHYSVSSWLQYASLICHIIFRYLSPLFSLFFFSFYFTFFFLFCSPRDTFYNLATIIKDSLHYKTIAFQDVSSEGFRKAIFRSQVFVFLTIPRFTKSVTSWWVLVYVTVCIFEYIFWTTTHYVPKLGQLTDINKDNNFQEPFEQFGGQRLSSRSFSI